MDRYHIQTAKIENLIKHYECCLEETRNFMDDDGQLPQGTYNELECELGIYYGIVTDLKKVLGDE